MNHCVHHCTSVEAVTLYSISCEGGLSREKNEHSRSQNFHVLNFVEEAESDSAFATSCAK